MQLDDCYLAESIFYITSKDRLTFETNSISAIAMFEQLLYELDPCIRIIDKDDLYMTDTLATSRISGGPLVRANPYEYIVEKHHPDQALHDLLWSLNHNTLSKLCSKKFYDSIDTRALIKRGKDGEGGISDNNKRFWIATTLGASVQLTLLGSTIIVGSKSVKTLHTLWLWSIKIYIESMFAPDEEDEEEEEEDTQEYDELDQNV